MLFRSPGFSFEPSTPAVPPPALLPPPEEKKSALPLLALLGAAAYAVFKQ